MTGFSGITTPLLLVGVFVANVNCDIYLHNPRGSNNRLSRASSVRQNAQRLFDSQNNAKGGYNIGEAGATQGRFEADKYKMIYFQSGANQGEETLLTIDLFYQHGCSSDELGCSVVLQYMCQAEEDDSDTWQIRDGSNEDSPKFTIPRNDEAESKMNQRRSNDLRRSIRMGQHESWDSYNHCYLRERNYGLFTADRKLRNNALGYSSAVFTRQNSNGKRYGLECPEERDHYPYWHPSQWKDLAILTDNPSSKCQFYRENSFSGTNTLGVCVKADGTRDANQLKMATATDCTGAGYKWVQVYNYLEKADDVQESNCRSPTYIWGVPHDAENFNENECLVALPKVDCQQAPWAKANHLGLTKDTDEFPRYTWKLPYFPSETAQRCVLRARYNITNGDIDHDTIDSTSNQVRPQEIARKYRRLAQMRSRQIQRWRNVTRAEKHQLIQEMKDILTFQAENEIREKTSPLRQNPRVKLFPDFPEIQLAINTDQTGRVFQDRSHAFRLVPRPSEVPAGRKIYNLNVRGKRGNIVQAYNAVEYDFVPNNLEIGPNDLIHIQWTGSNSQPGDGQGKRLTDRSNIVQIADYSKNYPVYGSNVTMWRNAKVYWTPFQSSDLFGEQSALPTQRNMPVDQFSRRAIARMLSQYFRTSFSNRRGNVREPNIFADRHPVDRETLLDDEAHGIPPPIYMRKKREADSTPAVVIGPDGLTDQQLALALMTSGYYWCVERSGCPDYVPDNYVNGVARKRPLTSLLDEAPASFQGVLVSFNRGSYYYMSSRNNKFTNRSQKGRIIVS